MAARIFIDGEAGTTGLQIRERLAARSDLDLVSLSGDQRKDPERRREMLNAADVAILCLPDDAAREAVAMIENPTVRVIDASTAHRTAPGWVYGFPELDAGQTGRIAGAARVTNPGCYALSSVAMIHPLVTAGIVPADHPVTLNAVSGYSGGGRRLIERFENAEHAEPIAGAYRIYALGLEHKHLPEIHVHGGLARPPVFLPSVGRFRQGMAVALPLALWALPGGPAPADVHAVLAGHYAGRPLVTVADWEETAAMDHLDPEAMNGTNALCLHVLANPGTAQAVVVALLDNLGKGASGQAVQNLNIMLGLPETEGLTP